MYFANDMLMVTYVIYFIFRHIKLDNKFMFNI